MAVRFYDEALANKIENWTKSHPIRVLKPSETSRLFSMTADEIRDNPIQLPLIALSRDTNITVLNTNKQPLSFDGMKIWAYDNNGNLLSQDKMLKLNAIPMQLEYQLDIYTRNLAEADEYMRNFVFNFVNYPNVTIEIPYNDCKLMHESTVYLNEVVEDNSDIPQRLFSSQFTRYTLKLTIDNAYLFSAPVKDNLLVSSVVVQINSSRDEVDETYVVNLGDK